jgi:phthalate 4,5-dioxygenase oxygenase subunit
MPMLNAEDNDLLCSMYGDAPIGQMMRRHWLPACLSEEVAERDGPPARVRLLGGTPEERAVPPASRTAE